MTYTISGKTVGKVGFGLMSMYSGVSFIRYNTISENNIDRITGLTNPSMGLTDEQGIEAIRAAISCGANYLDGGQFYGPPTRNSLTLLNKYFEKYPEDVGKIVLNIKGGMGPDMAPAGDTESIRRSIETCLQALGPVGRIDQFEAARKDPNVPYEETLAAIQSYVDAGKIGGIACSELGADTLRKAAEKFKITALEIEVSLFRTEPLTNGLLATCAEFDIPVLAYCKRSNTSIPVPLDMRKVLWLY
jgi:pyridoxine 4-dehydrogenase